MDVHILGICGTFMGGIALLAKESGYNVSGCDKNVYPPMSKLLESNGIELMEGFDPGQLDIAKGDIVVGNALSRGNPLIEALLDSGRPYISGPQWLAEKILHNRWVLAVAGTHGKTTTSSMLAWILEFAGLNPGFLIGGVPLNFGISARLGESRYFVVEADEYDTAFFDKRSKFVHYHPKTAILNNLEFDHADIFSDLSDIQKQFHHLVRTVPNSGLIISKLGDPALQEAIDMGCWTPREVFSSYSDVHIGWSVTNVSDDQSSFDIRLEGETVASIEWSLQGFHNIENALAAIAAARHVGISPQQAAEALKQFKGIKRRMEVRGCVNEITVYDDFAHHPTAIQRTLQGLRCRVGEQRVIVALEPRSNTMKLGIHKEDLPQALEIADRIHLLQPESLCWSLQSLANELGEKATVHESIETLQDTLVKEAQPGDHIILMSNGAFGGLHESLVTALKDST